MQYLYGRAARRVLEGVTSRMAPPRIIFDGTGKKPYLSRYYIRGGPFTPDGSAVFDHFGDLLEGCVFPDRPWGAMIHHFHASDVDRELHNHPWEWSVSLILVGGYMEDRRVLSAERSDTGYIDIIERREFRPGDINVIGCNDFHRVDLLEDDAWTLFVHGRKTKGWGFWERYTETYTPWKEFVSRVRDPAIRAREERVTEIASWGKS